MKTITMKELAELVAADPALRRLVQDSSAPELPAVLDRIAAQRGLTLKKGGAQALSDDALDAVAGGRDPFADTDGGELNPYSWFVSFFRRLTGRDDEDPAVPGRPGGQSRQGR